MNVESIAVPAILKLITNLGPGEAEALALSPSQPTDLVLLDDALARQVASSQALRYTGTLGVLIQAKQQAMISAVLPYVEEMERAGFRVSDTVKLGIRRISGE